MGNSEYFWFRTRQDLLEEWGYIPGVWHLIRRSQLSITVIGVSAQGKATYMPNGRVSEIETTRVTLALLDAAHCEFVGPFAIENVPAAANLPWPTPLSAPSCARTPPPASGRRRRSPASEPADSEARVFIHQRKDASGHA